IGRVSTANDAAFSAPADDVLLVGNGTTWQDKTLPTCTDTGGNHLNYDPSTNTFACGTSGGAGGGAPASATYLVVTFDGTLTNERGLVIDTQSGMAFTDGGANGNYTVSWAPQARNTNLTFWDNTGATRSLTADVAGAGTDPVITFTASS